MEQAPCHPGSAAGAIRDVGDVEADDAGALQLGLEAALEFGAVGALHDEDDVCPFLVIPAEAKRRAGTGRDTSILPDSPLGLSRETADRSAGVEINRLAVAARRQHESSGNPDDRGAPPTVSRFSPSGLSGSG